MEFRKIWLILVRHDFQAIGSGSCFAFRVDSSAIIHVADLKKEVKEEAPNTLSRFRVDPDELTVWKTKGEMVINRSTSKKRLEEILKSIDVDDVDAIEQIRGSEGLADVELPDGQVLIVRLPGSSRISTAVGCVLTCDTFKERQFIRNVIKPKVDRNHKYKDLFLRASTTGKFTSDDIDLNRIMYVCEDDSKEPQFVKELETILRRKRKLPAGHNVGCFSIFMMFSTSDRQGQRAAAKILVRKRTLKEYFDCSTVDTSESGPDQSELCHISHVSHIPEELWGFKITAEFKPFKESDANWLFFFFIARHFKSLNAKRKEAKFSVKQ